MNNDLLSIINNIKLNKDFCKNRRLLIKILNDINDRRLVGKNPVNYLNLLDKKYSKEQIINLTLSYYDDELMKDFIEKSIKNNNIILFSSTDDNINNYPSGHGRCRKEEDGKIKLYLRISNTLADSFIFIHELTHFLILNNKEKSNYNLSNDKKYSEIEPILNEYYFYNYLLSCNYDLNELDNVILYRKCVLQQSLTKVINSLYVEGILSKEERIDYGIRSDSFSQQLSKITDFNQSIRYVNALININEIKLSDKINHSTK